MYGSRSANRARCRSPQPRTDCEPNTGATRARSRPHPSPSPDRVRARPVLPQGLAAPFCGDDCLAVDKSCPKRRVALDPRTPQITTAASAVDLAGKEVFDLLHQPVEIDRLGVELVAAGRQRPLAGAGHGMCGERDDRNMPRL